jgi:phage-related protein/predicted  nucleic acid-binding Zn-ribbon protein
MASSFGGSIKLTGESEYTKALKTITSNLTVMASEMKLVSTQFDKNDKSVQAITSRNTILNKEIEEGNKKVATYRKALEDFKTQQDKNASGIMELMVNLEKEKKKLDELKNSTTATSDEIKNQEKIVADLSTQLAKEEAQYDKNKLTINKYQTQLNNTEAEVNKLNTELKQNNASLNENKSSYDKLNDKIAEQKSKLNELKVQYGSVVLEQGKNSKEAKALAGEIKTLSGNIKDNETKIRNSTKAIDEFTSSEKSAGNETLKLGDLIKAHLTSEAIIAGVKGLASAMGTMVNGIVNLGKEAIANYAEYEQLVGGVETLFKDSAGIVEGYANNAYKTAGLSANQYMETVTSFSASLLQSLNNDTAKSAEVADMAITDMSDNANKMGTDMSMIQSAYQGFAKQNYTMLDNLKLGYGGTKSEMERLLADASKISGVKYDISSLNDVYQAIHVIQGELGITGTTAKEASTTISGSINSMKSAWMNLVTGIADDNANFDSLISNFVESVMTMAENIVPRISIALDGIVNLILGLANKLLPQVLEMGVGLIQNLITGITGNIDNLMSGINQVIQTILQALVSMLPQIIEAGIQVIVSLITGIASSLPTLIPQIIDCVLLIAETLLDNIDLIIDAGIQLIIGLAEGLLNALPQLIDKIPIIIDKLVSAITDNLPKIIEMGVVLIVKLAVGLVKAIPQLVSKTPQIITSLINGIANYYGKLGEVGKNLLNKVKDGIVSGISKITDVGKNLVQGLWNGINNAKDWVLNKIKGFGQSILNGIKSFFGIHSPSTVFKDQIGTNLALGIGEGFTEEMNNVSDLMQNAIPTDFDVGVNTNYDNLNMENNTYSLDLLITAFKEALNGMSFKVFDEIFGELIIDKIEKVVYS